MQVTSNVTRPGIASKPNQNENHDSITTKVDGANVWIRWWPIWRSNRKCTVNREKLPAQNQIWLSFVLAIKVYLDEWTRCTQTKNKRFSGETFFLLLEISQTFEWIEMCSSFKTFKGFSFMKIVKVHLLIMLLWMLKLTMFFRHVTDTFSYLKRRSQIILQQFKLWIQYNTGIIPLQAHFLVWIWNCRVMNKHKISGQIRHSKRKSCAMAIWLLTAFDVNWAYLNVHRVQLKFHLTRDDRMHAGCITYRLILV